MQARVLCATPYFCAKARKLLPNASNSIRHAAMTPAAAAQRRGAGLLGSIIDFGPTGHRSVVPINVIQATDLTQIHGILGEYSAFPAPTRSEHAALPVGLAPFSQRVHSPTLPSRGKTATSPHLR
jgi:hypothetical protein